MFTINAGRRTFIISFGENTFDGGFMGTVTTKGGGVTMSATFISRRFTFIRIRRGF